MSYDDFDVIVYKVLEYIYSCLRKGVYPNLDKAQEIARCNDVYWKSVIRSMCDDGYLIGVTFREYRDMGLTPVASPKELGISQEGARYLKENSKMAEVKGALGAALFWSSVELTGNPTPHQPLRL